MGCCNSTPSSPTTQPQAAPLPDTSSRAAINQPAAPSVSSRRSASSVAPTTTRPNKPIRAPSPLPTSPAHIVQKPPPWTRKQLEGEREAFFESRVTGDAEVWKALGVVCEGLRKEGGGGGEGEGKEDGGEGLLEAQGILDAMGITCPSGRVASGRGRDKVKGGVYDERGVLYELPVWVVRDPDDIVEENGEEAEEKPTDAIDAAAAADTDKGKARQPDIGPLVRIRCRLSDRGSDVTVEVGTKQQVSVLIRKLQEQVGSKRMRIMYLGKALDERRSIGESGWREGHVVNAMVFEGDEGMVRAVEKKAGSGK